MIPLLLADLPRSLVMRSLASTSLGTFSALKSGRGLDSIVSGWSSEGASAIGFFIAAGSSDTVSASKEETLDFWGDFAARSAVPVLLAVALQAVCSKTNTRVIDFETAKKFNMF